MYAIRYDNSVSELQRRLIRLPPALRTNCEENNECAVHV
jgi:hypothetical protein